jgi:pullulanase/glycogen debranching enzyme
LTPHGREMQEADWNRPKVRVLGVRLNGKMLDEFDELGRPITGATLLVLFSAEDHDIEFLLPEIEPDRYWSALLDTSDQPKPPKYLPGGYRYPLHSRSTAILERKRFRPTLLGGFLQRRGMKNVPVQTKTEVPLPPGVDAEPPEVHKGLDKPTS